MSYGATLPYFCIPWYSFPSLEIKKTLYLLLFAVARVEGLEGIRVYILYYEKCLFSFLPHLRLFCSLFGMSEFILEVQLVIFSFFPISVICLQPEINELLVQTTKWNYIPITLEHAPSQEPFTKNIFPFEFRTISFSIQQLLRSYECFERIKLYSASKSKFQLNFQENLSNNTHSVPTEQTRQNS